MDASMFPPVPPSPVPPSAGRLGDAYSGENVAVAAKPGLRNLLSGIEAGIIGGIAMFALLVTSSLLRHHVWWETPNLLGSTFYGIRAFRAGPGMASISGTALHLTITGIVGGLFGLACGGLDQEGRSRRHLIFLGVVTGLVWYLLADAVFWKRVNPLVPLYSPKGAALLSHALYGACLGYMGNHMGNHLGTSLPPEPVPPPLPVSQL